MENARKKTPMKSLVIAAILTVVGTALGWFIRNT